MAITASGVYWLNLEKYLLATASLVSWESAACKYALDDDADVPAFDTDAFRSDLTEVTGTNYVAGGDAMTTSAVTISAGIKYDFDDPQWLTSTITAMGGAPCSGDATNTADEAFFLQDFVTEVQTTAGTLDVAIHVNGALTFA